MHTPDQPLNPPHSEDVTSTEQDYILGEVVTINGITDYYIANRSIEDMSLTELKQQIVSLMEDAR